MHHWNPQAKPLSRSALSRILYGYVCDTSRGLFRDFFRRWFLLLLLVRYSINGAAITIGLTEAPLPLVLLTIVCICKLSASPCKLKQALHVILQEKARLISEGCMQNELINSRLEPRTPNASHRSTFCNSVQFR